MKKKKNTPSYVMVHVHCPEISELPLMSHFVWLADVQEDGHARVEVSRAALEFVAELTQGT